METLHQLENSIAGLSPGDYLKFRDWFWEHEQQKWDVQIESDIRDNKLEAFANAAIEDYKDGRYSSL